MIRPTTAFAADRLVWAVALGVALAAHASVIYLLAREPDDHMAGGGGQQIDAISVTIVSSTVLESREVDRPQPSPPAAAASVDMSDGAPDSAPAPAAKQREEKKEEQEEKKEKPKEEPVRAVEAITEVPQEQQHQRKQESAAPAAGGAAVRSDTPVDAEVKASAPAAASPGAVRDYARYVALALSKTKPKGVGGLGTARVKFVIAADGGIASLEVAKSSGSAKLDSSALESVRRTRFPLPPAGMTLTQLTYEVPYHFR
jgi:protein TonB